MYPCVKQTCITGSTCGASRFRMDGVPRSSGQVPASYGAHGPVGRCSGVLSSSPPTSPFSPQKAKKAKAAESASKPDASEGKTLEEVLIPAEEGCGLSPEQARAALWFFFCLVCLFYRIPWTIKNEDREA